MAPSPLDPDAIARKTFLAGFRGYEQAEVRAYLHDLGQEVHELLRRLAAAEARIAELEPLALESDAPIDPSRLASLVGEETARVLEAAREAADGITTKAEETAARIVKEATAEALATRQAADDDAREVRHEAARVLEERTAEAEVAADEIRARAERDAATMRDDAVADVARTREEAERIEAEAAAHAERLMEEAKAHGRAVVSEAQALRKKILTDLARRRQASREQVARLEAGRERLLAAYETVRTTLDAATGELTGVVGEARAAADTAALRISEEELPSVEELEAELHVAADADLLEGLAPSADTELDLDAVELGDPDDAAEPTDDLDAVAGMERSPETAAGSAVEVGTDELPEIDPDLVEEGPVEDPPDPIIMPKRGVKRRLLRREPAESKLLPPAELQPLTEPHEVEGVRIVAPRAGELGDRADPPTEAEDPVEPGSTDDVAADSMTESANGSASEAVDGSSEEGAAGASSDGKIDELFARIRAGRADELARAEEVLGNADGDDAEPPGEQVAAGAAPLTDRDGPETAMDETGTDDDGAADVGDGEASATEVDSGDDQTELDAGDEIVEGDQDEPTEELTVELVALTERDDALDPLDRELGRRLKRVLADEQNELLDALRRAGDDDVLSLLPDAKAHVATYATAAGAVLADAAEAGAAAAGAGDDAAPPDVDDIGRRLGEAICSPLRDRFEKARSEADGDPDALDTRLRAVYREWKSSLLPDAAGDALVAAWSAGVVAASGGCRLQWLVAPGAAPCPDADDNALDGSVEAGSTFPTGDVHPPAHPGCRCLVVPVKQ